MKILFLIPYTPTPIRTRSYYLLRALARGGHNLTLATVWEHENELAELERWRQLGVHVTAKRLGKPQALLNMVLALPGRTPLQGRYCWQPALGRQLGRLAAGGGYDVVHVEHLRGAPYALYLQSLKLACPLVWDAVDCISLLFERAAASSQSSFGRWMARLELPRTRRYEGWLVNQFARVLATAEGDKQALEKLAEVSSDRMLYNSKSSIPNPQSPISNQQSTISNITVLPNGVDLEYFQPAPPGEPRQADTLVLTGKMSYHANITAAVWLVNEIMPRVWAQRPQVKVQIVGSAPSHAVLALAKRYPHKVEVTGWAPDLRPYLQRATLAVAPVRYGVGVQNKVLEAMACGTPVAATWQAVSALQARPGEELLAAEGAEELARAVLQLLEDGKLRDRLGQAGRSYVEEHHEWNRIAGQLEEIYTEEIRRFKQK